MKILVTGAAGRLGRAILEQSRGRHQIVGIDLVEPPDELLHADHVRFFRGDACDEQLFRQAAAGCEAVCHTAALHGGNLKTHNHRQYIETNVIGTDMVCRTMVDLGIKTLVYSSTAEVTIGRRWDSSGVAVVTDQTPPCPDSIYSLTKLMAEKLCRYYSRHQGLRIACLRYCGFDNRRFRQYGTGLVSRSLNPTDVAEANLKCVECDRYDYEVMYVAPVSPLTPSDMPAACTDPQALLEKYWPGSVSLLQRGGIPTDQPPIWPKLDVARLRRITGWEPAYTFDSLLEELRAEVA